MANIWTVNSEINEHPNRNNHDLSFQNHLTMKMGTLYPIFCKEVHPGESFRIDTAYGLKFMPLVFPVQSKMTAYVHFFYVRNKNLWKNWQNWIEGREIHTHPYIDQPSRFFKTGSLSDYLNVCTTNISYADVFRPVSNRRPYNVGGNYYYSGGVVVSAADGSVVDFSASLTYLTPYYVDEAIVYDQLSYYPGYPSSGFPVQGADVSAPSIYSGAYFVFYPTAFSLPTGLFGNSHNSLDILLPYGSLNYIDGSGEVPQTFDLLTSGFPPGWVCGLYACLHGDDPRTNSHLVNYCDDITSFSASNRLHVVFERDSDAMKTALNFVFGSDDLTQYDFYLSFFANADATNSISFEEEDKVLFYLQSFKFPDVFFVQQPVTDLVDSADVVKPYGNDAVSDHYYGLSALPYRAYESIYNAYYRNSHGNQDFYIDGVPQYNRYITTDEDGADTTDYHLFNRNWEQDFLTSCMPSPQQGIAPLVGMSALGEVTIQDENGITTGQAVLADDNETITKIVLTSPAASVDHARTVLNIASAGMSINDFRNVNAFQRWLETNLRKGTKYRDFIAGHFGVYPKYNELDMPEFIGGTSQNVTVSQVTNMADTETLAGDGLKLGQFVGSANCFGATKHHVSHYCDDYGFIMGIICVVPTPSYSQLLPKMFLKKDPLDYYFSEFSQLGLQPITYKEVTPIQSYHECLVSQTKHMTDTFGYQRPNYDLVSSVDEVHGQFRSTLSNFLLQRLFAVRPELGSSFLTINPADTNHIFSYTSPAEDNIIGQVVIKCIAKRPVPRVTIPGLGR